MNAQTTTHPGAVVGGLPSGHPVRVVDRRLTGVTTICVLLIASCASHGGSPRGTSVKTTGVPGSSAPTSGQRNATFDLHSIDWNNAAVPGRSCLNLRDIRLHDGHALLPDSANGYPLRPGSNGIRYDQLSLKGPVVYGDFEGNGHDDAAVSLDCNNNGGTADGALLYSVAIYSGRTGKLTYLGLITAQHQPKDVLPTLLSVRAIAPRTITVQEYWYGPNDGTCCPAGRATTSWSLSAGKVMPVTTKVTANPK